MANVQITQLPAALPLDGTELVPVVQGGVTVRTTTAAVAGSPSQQQTFLTVNQEPTLPNSRYLTADPGISVTDGGAQSTLNLSLTGAAASLNAASTGFVVKNSGSTVVNRSIAVSGVGLSIANGSGVAGNPTISLSGQIANFASASGGGLVTLSSGGAVSSTSILGTSGQIAVANGDGIASNPTLSLVSTGVTPGTYGNTTHIPVITVDAKGRLTSVSQATITATGTVFEVDTGLGLTGGPITTIGTIAIDTSVTATVNTSQVLENKTISGALNSLSAIPNSSLTYSSITINGTPVSLGGSIVVSAVIANALTAGTGLTGGSYDGTAPITFAIDSTVATLSDTQTLTNKSMSGSTNTFTNISNSSLTNDSVTFNGTTVALGGSGTITAANPNALTIGTGLSGTSYDGSSAVTIAIDSTVATLTGTQTLQNKSISGNDNTLSDIPNSALSNSSLTIGSTSVSLGGTTSTLAGLTSVTLTQDPSAALDAATKQYVDSVASGINFHQACYYATTAALGSYVYNNGSSGVGATITQNAPYSALSIDGHTFTSPADIGVRVLVKNEPSLGGFDAYNGIYTVTAVGSGITPWVLTRATDYDTSGTGTNEIDAGDLVLVLYGSTNANTSWVQQTPLPITVGTTPLVWVQFAAPITYTAGTGLTLTGTTFSITNTGVSAATYGGAASVPQLAINAQGQVTSASDVSIAINGNQITSGTVGSAYISGSYTGITGVGTLTAGTWNASTIGAGYGGTGLSSYSIGDITYASGATTLSKLTLGTSGYVLTAGASAPQYVAQSTLSVGSATNATNTTNVATTVTTTNSDFYIPFVAAASSSNQALGVQSGLKYNPSTQAVTAGISGGTF